MATFNDKKNRNWTIELDPVLIEEVLAAENIDLTDLENDALLKLLSHPMKLAAVIYQLCLAQATDLNVSKTEFLRSLPHADVLVTAVKEAIIGFFPSGRASHAREGLTDMETMLAKAEEIHKARKELMLANPRITEMMIKTWEAEADRIMQNIEQGSRPANGTITEQKSSAKSTDSADSMPATTTPESLESAVTG